MSDTFDPELIRAAMTSSRWSGLIRTGLRPDAIGRWDLGLLRESRVLVPVDVQALYVPPGDATRFVALPFALTTPDGQPPAAMPAPFADGATRPAGVHLHWAPPDALLRGAVRQVADGSANRLGLPALPDRWVVVRILVPAGQTAPHVRGWVLEADTARAVPLEQWPAGAASAAPAGKAIAKADLTGSVGGTVNWAGIYDAVTNRLAFHDPLDDLATVAPQGAVENLATYVVAGWWSEPRLDPLDGAQTTASLHDRLRQLGWRLVEDAEGGDRIDHLRSIEAARRFSLGLDSASRYGVPIAGVTTLGTRGVSAPNLLEQLAEPTMAYAPSAATFADEVAAAVATTPRWPRSTLLHGVVHGVAVSGPPVADQRPGTASLGVVLGLTADDVAAALASAGLGAGTPSERRGLERLLAAFTGQLLSRLGTADGVVDVEEHEHASGFASRPGGQGPVERLRLGGQAGPLTAGRAARSEQARLRAERLAPRIRFTGGTRSDMAKGGMEHQRTKVSEWAGRRPASEPQAEVREVRRPAPRFHVPIDPLVAVRGAKRNLRHHGDGRFSPDGRLQCRWPSQVPTAVQGVVDGADVIPSLPTGAVPDEVLLLVRSALVQDPYLVPWLSETTAGRRGLDPRATRQRLAAEAALRFGASGVYDGRSQTVFADPARARAGASDVTRLQVADELKRFSLVAGVDADPVGVTTWSQPWVPLWLEWEVEVGSVDRFEGWGLAEVDLRPPGTPPATSTRTLSGRSALHTGTARTLAAGIEEWIKAEEQRDQQNAGEADAATAQALDRIADAIAQLDVMTASLDSLHQHLLGLPVDQYGVLHQRNGGGAPGRPVPVAAPQLLLAGSLRLTRARIVDAFGRTLDLPVAATRVPAREEVTGPPVSLRLRPRLLRPARWLFRLVNPADPTIASPEATIDQIDPTRMVNPVAGFLLPDHIDEALEVFDASGTPLGQLMHEPFGGGVIWEIAPGRSGPPDAGPLHDLEAAQQMLGHLAAGLVAADAAAREGDVADPAAESALSAFLRAIDTTLWTVDAFAGFGNEHIAGLVGRPIAVVRATLRLDLDDDLDELDLSDETRRAEREAAYRALADRAFPVRLGELTRSDDGLLAFFVDDDYRHVHVVDKVVREGALDTGRGRGQLGRLGTTTQVPDVRPIDHPYVVAEDELRMHVGQVVRLTLLMHPASKVHLTSGILPRKSLQLARDWVHPGLSVMAPSARIGPVLLDPEIVRLPKISAFPKDQVWTRRTAPATWKDDPILAATQTAILPDLPAEVQEGYIRVAPPGPRPGDES